MECRILQCAFDSGVSESLVFAIVMFGFFNFTMQSDSHFSKSLSFLFDWGTRGNPRGNLGATDPILYHIVIRTPQRKRMFRDKLLLQAPGGLQKLNEIIISVWTTSEPVISILDPFQAIFAKVRPPKNWKYIQDRPNSPDTDLVIHQSANFSPTHSQTRLIERVWMKDTHVRESCWQKW